MCATKSILRLRRNEPPGIAGGSILREDGVKCKQKRYSPAVRERAVRMVLDHQTEYALLWQAVVSIAAKFGRKAQALRRWVRQTGMDAGRRGGTTTEAQPRIKDLVREVRELRRANEILRKASAFFAQVELDRRQK